MEKILGVSTRLWRLLHLLHHFGVHRVYTLDMELEELGFLGMTSDEAMGLATKFYGMNETI